MHLHFELPRRLTRWRRLKPGRPTAPGNLRLPLLPSEPDGIHRVSAAWDPALNTTSHRQRPPAADLQEEFSLARADCEYRAPLSPRLARPRVRVPRAGYGVKERGWGLGARDWGKEKTPATADVPRLHRVARNTRGIFSNDPTPRGAALLFADPCAVSLPFTHGDITFPTEGRASAPP